MLLIEFHGNFVLNLLKISIKKNPLFANTNCKILLFLKGGQNGGKGPKFSCERKMCTLFKAPDWLDWRGENRCELGSRPIKSVLISNRSFDYRYFHLLRHMLLVQAQSAEHDNGAPKKFLNA